MGDSVTEPCRGLVEALVEFKSSSGSCSLSCSWIGGGEGEFGCVSFLLVDLVAISVILGWVVDFVGALGGFLSLPANEIFFIAGSWPKEKRNLFVTKFPIH